MKTTTEHAFYCVAEMFVTISCRAHQSCFKGIKHQLQFKDTRM